MILPLMPPPKIGFVGFKCGQGHHSTVKAVRGELAKSGAVSLEADKEAVTLNDHFTCWRGTFMVDKAYIFAATHLPSVHRYLYENAHKLQSRESRQATLRKWLKPGLAEALTKNGAKVLVSPHPMVSEVIHLLKIDGKIPADTKLVSLVTDLTVNETYYTPGLIIVPHPTAKEKLVAMGKDPNLVVVTSGLVARAEFRQPYDRQQVRAEVNRKLSEELGESDAIGTSAPLLVAIGGGLGLKLAEIVDFLPEAASLTPGQDDHRVWRERKIEEPGRAAHRQGEAR